MASGLRARYSLDGQRKNGIESELCVMNAKITAVHKFRGVLATHWEFDFSLGNGEGKAMEGALSLDEAIGLAAPSRGTNSATSTVPGAQHRRALSDTRRGAAFQSVFIVNAQALSRREHRPCPSEWEPPNNHECSGSST